MSRDGMAVKACAELLERSDSDEMVEFDVDIKMSVVEVWGDEVVDLLVGCDDGANAQGDDRGGNDGGGGDGGDGGDGGGRPRRRKGKGTTHRHRSNPTVVAIAAVKTVVELLDLADENRASSVPLAPPTSTTKLTSTSTSKSMPTKATTQPLPVGASADGVEGGVGGHQHHSVSQRPHLVVTFTLQSTNRITGRFISTSLQLAELAGAGPLWSDEQPPPQQQQQQRQRQRPEDADISSMSAMSAVSSISSTIGGGGGTTRRRRAGRDLGALSDIVASRTNLERKRRQRHSGGAASKAASAYYEYDAANAGGMSAPGKAGLEGESEGEGEGVESESESENATAELCRKSPITRLLRGTLSGASSRVVVVLCVSPVVAGFENTMGTCAWGTRLLKSRSAGS